MIIAGVLFIVGAAMGGRYNILAALFMSALIVAVFVTLWLRTGELDGMKALILAAYLSAFQAGYLTGSYWVTPRDPQ
ncbi:hypothetical protein [Methylobacterium soli]|uniref:Uncharacterized protein n=1 Tax=Methylobacterium soli TaxID=553447 RepID=A0A6L3SZX3_9HYPH|nr:hypothetical protein [Methylobacterium soli]KAB1078960.1 hypothetical protein F6X53_13245 [Methylobacterium soli]GJE44454.1 hypothetical protein AEGHOMDF_3642 [Methylobacterium soli]